MPRVHPAGAAVALAELGPRGGGRHEGMGWRGRRAEGSSRRVDCYEFLSSKQGGWQPVMSLYINDSTRNRTTANCMMAMNALNAVHR